MKMLVIDDDRDYLEDLAAVTPSGVEVQTASNTEEAFGALRSEEPDVIILDLHMASSLAENSDDEGLAILGAVIGGLRGRVPVVIATDSEDVTATLWCWRLGATSFFRKSDGLIPIVRAAMDAAAVKCEEGC